MSIGVLGDRARTLDGVEAVELRDHPFFAATRFQPQTGALDGEPLHPLLRALLDA